MLIAVYQMDLGSTYNSRFLAGFRAYENLNCYLHPHKNIRPNDIITSQSYCISLLINPNETVEMASPRFFSHFRKDDNLCWCKMNKGSKVIKNNKFH